MKKLLLIIILGPISTVILAKQEQKWEKVNDKDGIEVFSKEVPGTDLLAFRAIAKIKIPYLSALALLRDVEESTRWDDDLKKKVTVDNISDIEAVTYSVVRMPWPLKNRDFVLINKLEYDEETKELVVISKSVPHTKFPKNSDNVRGVINTATIRFLPLEDGYARMNIEVHVDPKGAVPDWVVNLVQKDMPYDFIKRLQKHSRLYSKGPNPGVYKMIMKQKKDLSERRVKRKVSSAK